jgi:hypothetical protein
MPTALRQAYFLNSIYYKAAYQQTIQIRQEGQPVTLVVFF